MIFTQLERRPQKKKGRQPKKIKKNGRQPQKRKEKKD
jgi:hypothetical protein